MAEENQDSWPVKKFYFKVIFESQVQTVAFQEVSGLDIESEPIEYRHGNSPLFSTSKMSRIVTSSNVTLKKGLFVNDDNFWNWYGATKTNTIKRETVVIQLMDEGENPIMAWTLANAWPTQITVSELESNADEVAIETLELAHEGLTHKNGS